MPLIDRAEELDAVAVAVDSGCPQLKTEKMKCFKFKCKVRTEVK